MKPWHPLFAALLRPWVEGYYDVSTNVPVGDLPREADIVLVRRTSTSPPPFQGIWKLLTGWSVLEFKGPSVSPRLRDLDLLVEVGLGIDRRLNQDRVKKKQAPLPPKEVSFWYLANRLGKRFLGHAEQRLGPLHTEAPGIWRCTILLRPLFLVSRADLLVDPDSVSLHLVASEPFAIKVEVGKLLLNQPALWQTYGEFFPVLQPIAWQEAITMAKKKDPGPVIDLKPLVDYVGVKEFAKILGEKKILQDILEEISLENLISNLKPAKLKELKKRLQ